MSRFLWFTVYKFLGLLPRNKIFAQIHFASKFCVLLYWQRYCTALEQWASAKLCGVVSSRVRAAIPFDIGRSSFNCCTKLKDFSSSQAVTYDAL